MNESSAYSEQTAQKLSAATLYVKSNIINWPGVCCNFFVKDVYRSNYVVVIWTYMKYVLRWGVLILVWYFWIEVDHSCPPNKYILLSFAFLCDREQPARLNDRWASHRMDALVQAEQRQKLPAATFAFWVISSKICNQLTLGLLQLFCKGRGYKISLPYERTWNVFWDIYIYVYPLFLGHPVFQWRRKLENFELDGVKGGYPLEKSSVLDPFLLPTEKFATFFDFFLSFSLFFSPIFLPRNLRGKSPSLIIIIIFFWGGGHLPVRRLGCISQFLWHLC